MLFLAMIHFVIYFSTLISPISAVSELLPDMLMLSDLYGDLGGCWTFHLQALTITGTALLGVKAGGQLGQGVSPLDLINKQP